MRRYIDITDIEIPSDENDYDELVAFADAIAEQEIIQLPERKKGTWELMFNGQFKGGAYWFSCSKCNRIVPEVRNGGWNYCPNCGAYMREGGLE